MNGLAGLLARCARVAARTLSPGARASSIAHVPIRIQLQCGVSWRCSRISQHRPSPRALAWSGCLWRGLFCHGVEKIRKRTTEERVPGCALAVYQVRLLVAYRVSEGFSSLASLTSVPQGILGRSSAGHGRTSRPRQPDACARIGRSAAGTERRVPPCQHESHSAGCLKGG